VRVKPNKDNPSVLKISLKNTDKVALIDEEDFNDLMNLDISMDWILHLGIVMVRRNGERISIARLIRNAGKGTKILYEDGNHLNLRKDNLVIATGAGKSSPKEQLSR
jgi:hypothetical protein